MPSFLLFKEILRYIKSFETPFCLPCQSRQVCFDRKYACAKSLSKIRKLLGKLHFFTFTVEKHKNADFSICSDNIQIFFTYSKILTHYSASCQILAKNTHFKLNVWTLLFSRLSAWKLLF